MLIACVQVSELKKQVEQAKSQDDSMMLDDISTEQGDSTFRVGRNAGSDSKQKEKIRQIERHRREAHDVSL